MVGATVFSRYHPGALLAYFAAVLLGAMWFTHPVMLVISLVGGLVFAALLQGLRGLGRLLRFALPLGLLAAILNPAFSHQGVTILAWLPGGNPLTLESVWYGLAAGGLLLCCVTWFFCLNAVIPADHFLWLLGRSFPSLALLVSMVLGFIPRFAAKLRQIQQAQTALGQTPEPGQRLRRFRQGLHMLSIAVTWALENGVQTADSMKSRGYGLPGRTSYRHQPICAHDLALLGTTLALSAFVALGTAADGIPWRYYPAVAGPLLAPGAVWVYLAYACLCAIPCYLIIKEAVSWNKYSSPA